jgi:hypothetical protein
MPQILALGLHGTIIELFSACVLLAQCGEPNSIPIILHSLYEALVDLANLVSDPSYACRIEHANIKQTLNIMRAGPLLDALHRAARRTMNS